MSNNQQRLQTNCLFKFRERNRDLKKKSGNFVAKKEQIAFTTGSTATWPSVSPEDFASGVETWKSNIKLVFSDANHTFYITFNLDHSFDNYFVKKRINYTYKFTILL